MPLLPTIRISRRQFIQQSVAFGVGFGGLQSWLAGPASASLKAGEAAVGIGPLRPDPQGVLDLPVGFDYRIISTVGEKLDDGFVVPGKHDGMGAFAGPNGLTILVRNHELSRPVAPLSALGPNDESLWRVPEGKIYDRGFGRTPQPGGTTTLVYDTRRRQLISHRLSLAGTINNCAGGPTPWGTWITCEEATDVAGEFCEKDHGYNFEVPATARASGLVDPVPLKAMGRFRHEAVCVDPNTGIIYQTEDLTDGLIYRFIPHHRGKLTDGGRLQCLGVVSRPQLDTSNHEQVHVEPNRRMDTVWFDVEDIESPLDDMRLQGFEHGAARFARSEGMWWGHGAAYWCCTNGGPTATGQIWRYIPSPAEGAKAELDRPGQLELFLEPNDRNVLESGDNITVSPWGDLIICEDGGKEDYLVGVRRDGSTYQFARNPASDGEFAGACFSPDGSTLFINQQHEGRTLAITGPWPRSTGEGT